MPAMEIDRRTVLGFFGAGALSLAHPAMLAAQSRELYAATRKEPGGGFSAVLFDNRGADVMAVSLPGRGHDVVQRPGALECVAFARRPGTFAVAFGPHLKGEPKFFTASSGRHFYGHGVFSADGSLLYTSENDIESGEGVIGVRDATGGYRSIGSFPSHGIGPHDMAMAGDGRALIVANGGIKTHPDFGRRPLNLASMRPSLAYIDRENGDLSERVFLPESLYQLSIRHLAVAGSQRVAFGAQHKGPRSDRPPLIGMHERGRDIQLIELGEETYGALRNYVTSIEVLGEGEYVVATSAPGGVVLVLDLCTEKIVAMHQVSDVSGITSRADRRGFITTSGTGDVSLFEKTGQSGSRVSQTSGNWDNHAVGLML